MARWSKKRAGCLDRGSVGPTGAAAARSRRAGGLPRAAMATVSGGGTLGGMSSTALPTWPVAAGSLLAGFAVAVATGVRPLGGVVLVLGAGWCFVQWRRRAGTARAVQLVVAYVVAFIASHGLGHLIGAW